MDMSQTGPMGAWPAAGPYGYCPSPESPFARGRGGGQRGAFGGRGTTAPFGSPSATVVSASTPSPSNLFTNSNPPASAPMRVEDVFEASPVVPRSNTGLRFRAGGPLFSVPTSSTAGSATISAPPRPYVPQRPAAAFEQSPPTTPNIRFPYSQTLGNSPLPVGPEKTSGARSRWDSPANAITSSPNTASPAITISSTSSPELPAAPSLASISAETMPENVKAYVSRAFSAASQSEEQKNEMQRILLAKLEHAIKNGLLFSIDWDNHPIPSLPPRLGLNSYTQPQVTSPPIERPSWLKPTPAIASPRGAPRGGRGGFFAGPSFHVKAVTPGTSTTPFSERKKSRSSSRSRSRSPSKHRTRRHRHERSRDSTSRSRSRSRSRSKSHSRSHTHSRSSPTGSSSSKSDEVQVVDSFIPLNARGWPRGGRRGKMMTSRGRAGLTVSVTGIGSDAANILSPFGKPLSKKARKALALKEAAAVVQNPAELQRRAQRFARHLNQNGGPGSDANGNGEEAASTPGAGVRARLGQRARLIGPGGLLSGASKRSAFPSQSVGAYRTSGGYGASDDVQFDWSSCRIVGTCEDIEKQYLRLTTVLRHCLSYCSCLFS